MSPLVHPLCKEKGFLPGSGINGTIPTIAVLFFFFFWLEDNFFIMLCWFLLYINMNQSYIYIHPLLLETPSQSPPYPNPPGFDRAQDWAPNIKQQPPTSYLFNTWQWICFSAISQFVLLSLSSSVSTNLFSMFLFLLLPYKEDHHCHFSRFHVYALVYDTCFNGWQYTKKFFTPHRLHGMRRYSPTTYWLDGIFRLTWCWLH